MTNWEVRRLGTLINVQNGYAFDSKSFDSNDGVPLVRIRDLKDGGLTETRYRGNYDPRYIVKRGDYLIGMDGEFGCYEWKGGEALLNQRVCRLQDFSRDIDARFLFYGVNSHLKRIEDRTGFTTVKHLSSKQILDIQFPLPSLSEQRRIVKVLDKAFGVIERMRTNTETAFTKSESLIFSYFEDALATRGRTWQVKRVAELADHSLGKMLDRVKNKGNLKPYLRNLNVRWFDFDLSDVQQMRFQTEEESRYSLRVGDVLVCEGGYPGRAAIWNRREPMFFQKALHRVRFHNPALSKWFVYFLWNSDNSGRLKKHFSGTGIQHFTGDALRKFALPIPPADEIHRLLKDLDRLSSQTQQLAEKHQAKLSALAALKESFLHHAFTGKL